VPQRVAVSPAFLAVLFFSVFGSIWGFAQSPPDVASVKDLPSTSRPEPKYQRLKPLSIHSQPDFMRGATSSIIGGNAQATGFSLAHVISVPNFQGSFISRGKTWQFTMIGTAPWNGGSTTIPTHIVAVSLRLQNANLVTFTTIPVTAFETPAVNSPNFKAANYSTGPGIQFADAVQRAEWFHKMKAGWHTVLRPSILRGTGICADERVWSAVSVWSNRGPARLSGIASASRVSGY
jgi:hypothetical protein